jgi:hypothetical protein
MAQEANVFLSWSGRRAEGSMSEPEAHAVSVVGSRTFALEVTEAGTVEIGTRTTTSRMFS